METYLDVIPEELVGVLDLVGREARAGELFAPPDSFLPYVQSIDAVD